MYQLIVDAADTVVVTEHPDRDGAHGRLMRHVVTGDYYLRTIRTGRAHTTYELLHLGPDRHRPRSAGHAVIEHVDLEHRAPVDTPDVAADAARGWIDHHLPVWRRGRDTEPCEGHPGAVLTLARAEARNWFPAGTLLPEAARLAGAGTAPPFADERLQVLRGHAIAHPNHTGTRLAGTVTGLVEAGTPAAALAALVWWYALISWGATAQ